MPSLFLFLNAGDIVPILKITFSFRFTVRFMISFFKLTICFTISRVYFRPSALINKWNLELRVDKSVSSFHAQNRLLGNLHKIYSPFLEQIKLIIKIHRFFKPTIYVPNILINVYIYIIFLLFYHVIFSIILSTTIYEIN